MFINQNIIVMENQISKPDNYLVWAILSTVLCCLPLGIVSIVYAAKVDGLYASGDYSGAKEASDKAKQFALISCVAGIVVSVLYCLIMILSGM